MHTWNRPYFAKTSGCRTSTSRPSWTICTKQSRSCTGVFTASRTSFSFPFLTCFSYILSRQECAADKVASWQQDNLQAKQALYPQLTTKTDCACKCSINLVLHLSGVTILEHISSPFALGSKLQA